MDAQILKTPVRENKGNQGESRYFNQHTPNVQSIQIHWKGQWLAIAHQGTCMYICGCVYFYACVCLYVHVCIYVCVFMCACMYIAYVYMYIFMHTCGYMYVWMCHIICLQENLSNKYRFKLRKLVCSQAGNYAFIQHLGGRGRHWST